MDTHRHSWLSNDGSTRKELDHTIVIKLCRVFRGSEAPANTDHRLVGLIAEMCDLHPLRIQRPRTQKLIDVEGLSSNKELAANYNVTV